MAMKRVELSDLKKTKGKTDFEALEKLTDEEIEKAAREDPDSALPTEEELKQFRRPGSSRAGGGG
jgi:hypothetical protein